MSRGEVSTGKAIACRLPVKEDEIFRAMAERDSMTPGAYLRQIALERTHSG